MQPRTIVYVGGLRTTPPPDTMPLANESKGSSTRSTAGIRAASSKYRSTMVAIASKIGRA
jgi:hypothetical protein